MGYSKIKSFFDLCEFGPSVIHLKCKLCNSEFIRHRCHIRSDTKYCSVKCAHSDPNYREKLSKQRMGQNNPMYGKIGWNKGRKKKAVAFCNNCNHVFFREFCKLTKKWKTNLRFCSKECRFEYEKGKNHPCFGRPLSKSHIEKLRQHNTGRKLIGHPAWNKGKTGYMSLKARESIAKAHRGKISKSCFVKGLIPWNKERHVMSEEQKEHLRKVRLKQHFPKKDSKPEIVFQKALRINNIEFETHKSVLGQPDVFIKPNICLFIDGDFWHANPIKYKKDDIIINNKTASERWEKDKRITNHLTNKGFTVFRFWESDIINNVQNCVNMLLSKQLTIPYIQK